MNIKLLYNNALELIPLNEVKKFLRIDSDSDDDLLSNLINNGFSKAENFTNRRLLNRSWQVKLTDFNGNKIKIPYNISKIKKLCLMKKFVTLILEL